ncbi:hypothetical protein LIA77_02728 [Sarocladium implicatum]|nr:hypothetical protein LIA77_02728 [Sarocladium implicatum]
MATAAVLTILYTVISALARRKLCADRSDSGRFGNRVESHLWRTAPAALSQSSIVNRGTATEGTMQPKEGEQQRVRCLAHKFADCEERLISTTGPRSRARIERQTWHHWRHIRKPPKLLSCQLICGLLGAVRSTK